MTDDPGLTEPPGEDYREFFELAQTGLARLSTAGLFLTVNPRFCEIVGHAADNLIGRSFRDISHPDDVDLSAELVRQTLEGKRQRFATEKRYLTESGNEVWGRLNVTLVRDSRQQPSYFIAVVEGIDDLVLARSEAEKTSRHLQLALEVTNTGSWDLDLVNDDLQWSEEVFRIFELDPEKFIPSYEGFLSAIHPLDRHLVQEAYADSVSNHDSYRVEHRLLMKDGRIKHVIERGRTIYDDAGSALRSIGTVQDITREKNAEFALQDSREKLAHLNLELETQVVARTAELEQAMVKAREANQEKSRFLANMSHELRTPMHAILSFTHLASKHVDNSKAMHFLENIQQSAQRLTTLLDDLLDLSKLEAGHMQALMEPNNLLTIMQQVVSEFDGLLQNKSLQVNVSHAGNTVIECDGKLITQLLVNLLSNAIKYSQPNSQVSVTIDQVESPVAGQAPGYLKLAMQDQGIGIPPDQLQVIFDEFIQSRRTLSKSGGTGLGLAISRQIVDLHHGRIWAESPPPGETQGTVVTLLLPVNNRVVLREQAEAAALAHRRWRDMLQAMLRDEQVEHPPVATLVNDHACDFGQWLFSGGLNLFIDETERNALVDAHRNFHELAGEILLLHELGRVDEVAELMGELEKTSEQVLQHLDQLA